jgi:hypothetical protein
MRDVGVSGRQRGARDVHRAVQTVAGDRRRRHGQRLHGRAATARAAQGGGEGHQGRHGQPAGGGPVRGGAAGPGPDGPPQHRQGPRRRHHAGGPAVLRHGAGPGRPHHPLLRRAAPDGPAKAGAVRAGLRGGSARAPEGDHPPRPSSRATC